MAKYDKKKSFGQEWSEKTYTGRAVKKVVDTLKKAKPSSKKTPSKQKYR